MGVLETTISGSVIRTSHSHVVNEIGQGIIAGTYPIGSVLPGDADLVERFQVSRTVLREAMKTLSAKGLIVPRARIGTRVTERKAWNLFDADVLTWHFNAGVDQAFLSQLSAMRMALEPAAAALAAQNATEDDIRGLYEIADKMGESETLETLVTTDLQFHLAVLEASKNPFMYSVGNLIDAALVGIFKLSSPSSNRKQTESVAQDHRAVVEAIEQKDPAAAGAAMEAVIHVGRERVITGAAKLK